MTSSKKEYEENFYSILSSYHNNFIGYENWENILFKGNIIKDDINAAIANSSYFARDNKESWVESWVSLWHFCDLEDDEFKTTLADVVEKFNNNEYLEHEKLLHVIAILLFLSKQELYGETQQDILKQAKNNINANAKTPSWQQNGYKYDDSFDAYSLGYMDEESDKFRETITYLENKSQKAFNVGLEAKANTLLQDFKNNDLVTLEIKLALRDFNNIAIFSQINVADFINILLKVEHTNLRRIFGILELRYQKCTKLTQDLKFWKGVDKSLPDEIDKDKYPVKHFLMVEFKSRALKKIITILKSRVSE